MTHSAPTLHGLPLAEAVRHVGQLGQLARVDRFVADDGPGRGARVLRLVTGGGLELEVHPDRALDLGRLTVDAVPLTWASPAGAAAPGLYEAASDGWGRTFAGGLLTTCGLDHVGAPVTDGGRDFPQHGRFHAIPATLERAAVVGGELVVEAEVRQATLHQENLVVRRRVSAPIGGTRVDVHDVVTNEGWRSEPHLVLYHCNLGWPLVAPGARISTSAGAVAAVSTGSDPDGWSAVPAPDANRPEHVYRHDPQPGADVASARVTNPALGLALTVRYETATLPHLFQWSMHRPVQYVLGLEPSSTRHLGGRVEARAAGGLPVLEPGQSVGYRLSVEVERLAAGAGEP